MPHENSSQKQGKGLNIFEKYLNLWVVLCIAGGIVLGKVAPGFAEGLDKIAIYVGDAPVVSIPIAVCLFFLGTLFYGFIGPDAVDLVKMPFGLDLPVGATYGAGTVIEAGGIKMLQVPLWRSYLVGGFLLGVGRLPVPW